VNLLLDTQALLWWKEGSRKLGRRSRRAIETEAATVRVSAASAWEIAIKVRAGRLKLKEALDRWMPERLERKAS
jgi:PIN domain nuclease of toxin-antitoxin system